jgi:hypothetical protein
VVRALVLAFVAIAIIRFLKARNKEEREH